jgi:glycosyltransferase involved in cell wall biosynthesis
MRYVWEAEGEYTAHAPGGALGRAAFAATATYLRRWDIATTARAAALVANSTYTQQRIRKYYGREATIIEPPVDAARFARVPDPPPAADGAPPLYLCVSALVPYKRVELAVRAFAGRHGRLVVVGEGPDRDRLSRMAGPNVELRGRVDDAELDALYGRCSAVIHPALDDFGIVPVEAMAAGRPVVAFAEGGAADSIRDGEGGVVFSQPSPEAVAAAVDRLQQIRFEPARLRALARRFDRATFERRFAAFVDSCMRGRVA